MKKCVMTYLAGALAFTVAEAKVDLVTLPDRDAVQVTIYNSADLTLVRETRALTMREGLNRMQFSWANTLIDPTSLFLQPKAQADRVHVQDLVFPPRVQHLGIWNIRSEVSEEVPVEISYLTSGLSWRAFYMGTLTEDEKTMRLQGYVRVANNSGEDYANAQTRLIVGKVNLLDQIADLSKRSAPYGRPGPDIINISGRVGSRLSELSSVQLGYAGALFGVMDGREAVKAVKKEGLSEYFLYTIEGTETIPNGWSKRLPSFDVADIPVVNLYKYEEERYGPSVVRFLNFKNDEEHELGDTPIPGGAMRVFRTVDEAAKLSYEGQSSFKYIPVDEDVELNLGAVGNVTVQPKLMKFETGNYRFHGNGNISGWDEFHDFDIEVKNTRKVAVKVEVTRNFSSPYWKMKQAGDYDDWKKVDLDTVRFTLTLAPGATKSFTYNLATRQGTRRDVK